jgi:hypothetical protein
MIPASNTGSPLYLNLKVSSAVPYKDGKHRLFTFGHGKFGL